MASDQIQAFKLHPSLLGFTARIAGQRKWVLENSSSEAPVIVNDSLLLWALSVLPREFSESEARVLWDREPSTEGRSGEIWSFLCEQGLIVNANEKTDSKVREELWHRFGWQEAFTFQEATRSYPFVQMNSADGFRQDAERMRRYREADAPPPIYAASKSETIIPLKDWSTLPLSDFTSSFDATSVPKSIDDCLALILDYCAGERAQMDLGAQGTVLLKSVPSGGARHPAEIYLFVFGGADSIAPGGYHYKVDTHSLAQLATGNYFDQCRYATFDLFDKYDRPPIALAMFCIRVERAMWRYRDPRSARAPFIDIGHVLMAFRTASDMLGLSRYTYQKFREKELCDILGIDPILEPPVYVGSLV